MNTELIIEDASLTNKLVITKTLIGEADDLAKEHEAFQDRYIVGGRKALYELIGKIYFLAEKLDGCIDRVEQLDLLRNILLREYGIKTQYNTSDITVLVRYITRADRKTAHVYARAIETARANQIEPAQFARYLEQAGGVERIRADGVISNGINHDVTNNAEEMMNLTRKYLDARSELPIKSFKLSNKAPAFKSTAKLNYFACYERNGRYYVLTQLPVDLKQETDLIKGLSESICENLSRARRNVGKFHTKAMGKRSERTIREITKKRPELGAKMRARFMEAAK